MIEPDFHTFSRLAKEGPKVPVYRTVLADLETPVSAYWKIASAEPYSFLLESVVGGERVGRYSFIGTRPRAILRTKGDTATVQRNGESVVHTMSGVEDALSLLRDLLGAIEPHDPAMPPFLGGAVGFLSYDLVRFFERLRDENPDDLGVDDCCMMVCDSIIAFDHAKRNMMVIVNTAGGKEEYDAACAEIERVIALLRAPLPALPIADPSTPDFTSNFAREDYEKAVEQTKGYIEAGDGVQMVISQRYTAPVSVAPIHIYRALRALNPSPYMFLLNCGDTQLIGGSPEVLVTLEGRAATVRPIAGTRPRGDNFEEDARLETELLADDKERAEHLMLVDLGRNDLGRACEFGTVTVNKLMYVERYSHVMHIVSNVAGTLVEEADAFDLLRSTFPAGTVSGAPKIRAMEIIDELENTRRGTYAGAVGYIGYGGDMDMCITIRAVLVKDGMAHVQAGAGIVADSDPGREWLECRSKAEAVIRAVVTAAEGLE